jgi:hypothetical protein
MCRNIKVLYDFEPLLESLVRSARPRNGAAALAKAHGCAVRRFGS